MEQINLKYDREITIATGESRKSTKWINSRMLWSDLLARLAVPLRTAETLSEYHSFPKAKRDVIKDVGGFVGGTLTAGRRKAENIAGRDVITLDLDTIPTGIEIWPVFEDIFDIAACIYSTHSHTKNSNRLRVVIPLAREVSPDEYGAVARMIAQDIGIDYCDDTTFEPHRLMYWASCSRDADYVFEYKDAPLLDPDEILARYHDWTDTAEWPTSSRRTEAITRSAKKQGNPLDKPGVIGAFCKTYDIEAAIEKFLPEVYRPAGPGRYTFAGGSTEAGLVLYEDGAFAFSHHGTDPISGRLVNSFDLVRLHLYGGLDADAAEDTPVNRLPSYEKMTETALADETVAYRLTLDRVDMFDSDEDPDGREDTTWLKKLELTKKGDVAATINNVEIILKNDPRLADRYYYDAFRRKPIACGDLPWVKLRARNTPEWADTDDAGLRAFLEKEYKISAAGKVSDAVELAMLANSRHPVREYLQGLSWDGEARMETLFIKYLGAEDCPYTRAVTRAALIGAVARILQPGCKHDHMLVLVGEQGRRKSTTLIKLGGEWYTDSLHTIKGKEAFENIQGYWIIEMGEMAAARRAEIEALKQFLSKRSDNYRAAYARRTEDHPRQCAFFGSTNDVEFLRDLTGSRRFWPVTVGDAGLYMIDKLTQEVVDQIWAEAVCAYQSGEKWYLNAEMEALAAEVQRMHTPESEMAGSVREFLDREIPIDFRDRTIDERRAFWAEWDEDAPAGDELGLVAETMPRDRVCAAEIWCELFGEKLERLDRKTSFEIGAIIRSTGEWEPVVNARFGKGYGSRRGFYRKSGGLI
ncbi:MAG: hypothetical protein IKF75_01845 [Lachnospiraceae bacterium]|nr:hypothetical protein [Lachnospiraceae bacterium]